MTSILKLKIIRHKDENDEKLKTSVITVINNRLKGKLRTNENYRSDSPQTKISGVNIPAIRHKLIQIKLFTP